MPLVCCGGCTLFLFVDRRLSGAASETTDVNSPDTAVQHSREDSEDFAHNNTLREITRQMERDEWTLSGSHSTMIANHPLVLGGVQGVSPPTSRFEAFLKLLEQTERNPGYLWFITSAPGQRVSFRLVDEPHRLALDLLPAFPHDHLGPMKDMLLAAERAYARDVLGSKEPDLAGEYRITTREIYNKKGDRVGEPDYWRFDVRIVGETDDYNIEVWVMEERYEEDRALVDVKLVPRSEGQD